MGSLEKSTISMTFFIILLIAYGSSIGGVNVSNSVTQLFAPWPKLGNTVLQQCQNTDIGCNTSNLVLVTEHIAVAINYPAILFFTILGRVSNFFGAIITVLFGPEAGLVSVPFLDLAFLGIIVLPAVYEIFRLARGNTSAGTL